MSGNLLSNDPRLRELLIGALRARQRERIKQEPELLFLAGTHDGADAAKEAARLIKHMWIIETLDGAR